MRFAGGAAIRFERSSTPARRSKRSREPTAVWPPIRPPAAAIAGYRQPSASGVSIYTRSISHSNHRPIRRFEGSFAAPSRRDGRFRSIAPATPGHRKSTSRVVLPSRSRLGVIHHVDATAPTMRSTTRVTFRTAIRSCGHGEANGSQPVSLRFPTFAVGAVAAWRR